MITAEYLKKEIESLRVQQNNAVALMHEATGAIMLAESLLAKLEAEQQETTSSPEPLSPPTIPLKRSA